MNRLFVENLTVIDFAYLHARRGLVGESWIVDVELAGELDEQGMVFDFSSVKKTIKRVIDETVDHCLAYPSEATNLSVVLGDQCRLRWTLEDGSHIEHRSPLEAICPVPASEISQRAVAALLEEALHAVLPSNVIEVNLTLREEVIEGPYYHYVHGLKKHLGNCQRIAHGHRSRIRALRDGQRDLELETDWAQRWEDIYVGTEEDIAESFVEDDTSYLRFCYQANQGEFELVIPQDRVYLIETDSTVEWLADYLANAGKLRHPGSRIRVQAFEGVGKGAIAER